jgi:hypothetical protein
MVSKDKSMLSKLWISVIAIIVVAVVVYFISGEKIKTSEPLGIRLKPGESATGEQIEAESAKAEERIAELSAQIESRQPLQETMRLLSYARDERSIPVFREILKRNPRGVNRAAAVISLTVVEEGTQTGEAVPFLVQALKDPDTDVRLRAALGLIRLGRTEEPVDVLYRIALADDIEDWEIDWEGYFGSSEMETDDWRVQAAEFKNGMRVYAINGLGSIGTERTYALIQDVMEKKGNQAYFRGGQLMTYKDYIENSGVLEGNLKGIKPPVW